MRPSDTFLRRVMRRRKGPRLAAVVDHIKADDGPEFEALVKRIAELGFGQASFTNRSITLDVPEYFVAVVDNPAGRQDITPEKFISKQSRPSRTDERRRSRKKQTPPGREQT
jgi:hypothetical protein